MNTLSEQFIKKSNEATSFDWDNNRDPDPALVDDLFQWFDENVENFRNFPPGYAMSLGDRISEAHFNDASSICIQQNLLQDRVIISDGTAERPLPKPPIWIQRSRRSAYAYFTHIQLRQNQADHPTDN